MSSHVGLRIGRARCELGDMVGEDTMKQHPANLTEASPYKSLPLQLDVHTIIDLLKKLLHSYRPEEASASVEKLLEAQSQFGVWEDGVSASQGGLDQLLRDPKCLDLRDLFKSKLSDIKSLLTGGNLSPFL